MLTQPDGTVFFLIFTYFRGRSQWISSGYGSNMAICHFLKRLSLGNTTGWQHRFSDLTILSPIWLGTYEYMKNTLKIFFFLGFQTKDLRGTYVRRMTAATAAITLAFLFVEMLCYVLGRLHSSCVLSTKIVLIN